MMCKDRSRRCISLFASFLLVQFVLLRLANQAGRGYLPLPRQEQVYLYIQFAVVAGYLGYGLFRCIPGSQRLLVPLLSASLALCLTGGMVLLLSPPASLFYLIATAVSVALLGFAGGWVYEQLAFSLYEHRHGGLCIGAGYALAVAMQFCFQLQWNVRPVLALLLTLSFGILAAFLFRSPALQSSPSQGQTGASPRYAFSVVITFALLLFTGFFNRFIHHLQIASGYSDYNVYSWPRLLMIPTVILFGYLGDFREGKYLSVSTLCVSAVSLLNTALLGRDTYYLNMCLYYIALTAVVAYYHLTFLPLAVHTGQPALWACMGRVIDSGAVIVSFGLRLPAQSQAVVLCINLASLAAVIVLMGLSGALNLSSPPAQEAQAPADPFPILQERFGITPSELKVLRELVTTDDKQEAIASRLGISVSTLRHHITALYRKTGTQTRLALSNLVNAGK